MGIDTQPARHLSGQILGAHLAHTGVLAITPVVWEADIVRLFEIHGVTAIPIPGADEFMGCVCDTYF